ncbi:MAG: S41 family peptidase [Bacteroidota bacterium]
MAKRFVTIILLLTALFRTDLYSQWDSQSMKLMEVMDKINRFYVDTLNEQSFVENVITNMLHDLDPHSSYISEEELTELNEQMEGEFEGIGVSFNVLNDTIFIISTIQGGPSERVGIMPGDRIIRINSENVAGTGITSRDVQSKLKGKKGTRVDVSVLRRHTSHLMEFTITRDKIPVYSIDASYMVTPKIGYIKLSRFSQTSAEEFETALKELKELGMEDLILDLSGNGGGYLRTAVELADQFLVDNQRIVYTEGRKVAHRDYNASAAGLFEKGRLVLMINESSASASEIVAGAVQDWDRGVIVGRRSFGKGLVQQPFQLNDGSLIRLTVARYYTPTGRLIQKPYEDGFDDYEMDLINRYNKGELSTADSIHFPPSEKYTTLKFKRTVYGGGGIMPDYFVALDTTRYSDYYRSLLSRGILNQFILNYVDRNRTELLFNFRDFSSFRKNFDVNEQILSELVAYASQEGLPFAESEFRTSEQMITILIKAYLARDLYETSDFYEIFNVVDPAYQKAVEVLEKPVLYRDILKPQS